MTAQTLAAGIRALLVLSSGAYSWTHYVGEATGTNPPLPWLVSNVSVPDDAHLSEAAQRYAGDVDVYLTAAGRTETEANLIIETQAAALAGTIPVIAGYSLGAFIQYQRPRTYPTDQSINGGASRHMWVGVVGYRTTVSPAA